MAVILPSIVKFAPARCEMSWTWKKNVANIDGNCLGNMGDPMAGRLFVVRHGLFRRLIGGLETP